MGSYVEEEDYGRRLLPNVVDKCAKTRPDRIAYSFPIGDDPAGGFHHVTNLRYANGIDRTAWYIEQQFGIPNPSSFPSIGYIGPNDLRYAILAVAAVKVGYKMIFLSPRNSVDGHLAVIDRCGCDLWLLPSQRLGHVDQILKKRPMKVVPLPEQLELLNEGAVAKYHYAKTFTEARQDPFVVLHTSGSTGLPKPVIVPNGSLATTDAHHLLPPVEGRLTQAQFFTIPRRVYSTFPNFHSAGMVFCFALPFYYELSIVMGPTSVPVNLDLVNSMLDHADVDGLLLAPSTLEEISKDPSSLAKLARTSFTLFGGGPLNKQCGDRINAVTRVFNIMGVTEGSLFPIVQAEPEDWHYHHFHPAGGYTYKQRTEELWEQFQTRDPELHLTQAFLQTFPDQDEVATKDLYSKHPTKPGRWLYRGRTDDVIVLSNGEKVNPVDMEACINSHPDVKASIVVGQGKFQTAVLIELFKPLPTNDKDLRALKDSLWTNIQAANREASAHGQLHKDYILFASDKKPFVLAGKETVLRAMTVSLYESDINDFYENQEKRQSTGTACITLSDLSTIQRDIHRLMSQIHDGAELAPSDDFFVAGLDSLSVFKVLANLRASFQAGEDRDDRAVTAGLIYSNPTVDKLSRALDHLLRPNANLQNVSTTEKLMSELLEKYKSNLPERLPRTTKIPVLGASVIVTGTTGSLGSYLLDTLLSNANIRKVYCLNRSANARDSQIETNKVRGLGVDLSSDRVKFLQADLSRQNLGLSDEEYHELLQEVTHIIHNQWQVDFHLHLSSFEPHIRGVRHLVDFSLQSEVNAGILFVSSVGVVQAQQTNKPVPEALVTDFSVAEGGYGQSKLVSELILDTASTRSGVDCSVCRLGQIAGPANTTTGMWNKQEWLPSIIASSKYLGKLPSTLSSLDRVDWLPVDLTSSIIAELVGLSCHQYPMTASSPGSMRIFHGVNPSVCSWTSLVPTVASCLGPEISVVSWSEWLSALVASEAKADYDRNPGLKLLAFYKNIEKAALMGLQLPVLETQETQMVSGTLKSLEAVNEAWMSNWMSQWDF